MDDGLFFVHASRRGGAVLLFLHRGYFARAMIEYPESPLRSPFAPSFLAAYATSITFLRHIRSVFDIEAEMMLRFWSCWAHALAAAVRRFVCLHILRSCVIFFLRSRLLAPLVFGRSTTWCSVGKKTNRSERRDGPGPCSLACFGRLHLLVAVSIDIRRQTTS